MRELSREEANKLANFNIGHGYVRSEYSYTRGIIHDVEAFVDAIHALLELLTRSWPEGESHWFPLIQSLQYDDIQVPEHLKTFEFQSHVESLNHAALALEEACQRFSGTINPHAFNLPGPRE